MLDYIGTLDGAEKIANGDPSDAAWFSHGKYLSLLAGHGQPHRGPQKIMLSPVIIGVKQSVAQQLRLGEQPERHLEGHPGEGRGRLVPLRDDQPGRVEQRLHRADRRGLGALRDSSDAIDTGNIDTDGAQGLLHAARR